ncbi:DsbA family protein [Acidithrix ferrooxidans]|uniref:DSBA-like thioredoxin domain protein n=1 Tax=Acidithrix ferrooxidans TaxID=1280514 RepID=A0A0D8HK34_9ACTN|nr:DsbA family protein [Acidithrix ferrooxidans]KJF18320.1 DSBA-like thioredoxin domain protein [Acidithrix ferrooxidans]
MTKITKFSVNFDYRCPFARNMNEHVVTALKEGADFDVSFIPFNLSQVHVEEGEPSIWEDPDKTDDLLANEVGYIVSKLYPTEFPSVHLALFALRHEQAKSLKNFGEIANLLEEHGVNPARIQSELDNHTYSREVQKLHETQAKELEIFGVPTIFSDDQAAFVRIMTRPLSSSESSTTIIERVLDQIFNHPELNEVKHTTVAR